MSLTWDSECSLETVTAAWKTFNGTFGGVEYAQFEYVFAASCPETVPMDVFDKMTIENYCALDPVDEAKAAELAQSTNPLQPVVIGRFGGRIVILDGSTRYKAAEIARGNIRYLCMDFDQQPCALC
jgi:hypothetical protein